MIKHYKIGLLITILLAGCAATTTPQENIQTDQNYELKTIDKNYCEITECPKQYDKHDCYYCLKKTKKNE